MIRKTGIGMVLALIVAGCGEKVPSGEEIKSYQLTEFDLKTFAKVYPDVVPTFKNLIPTLPDLGEKPFDKMAKIKFPQPTAAAIKKTEFKTLGQFVKVYSNIKLGIIRILAEEKVKEIAGQKAGLDKTLSDLDKAVKEKKVTDADAKAVRDQINAQKQAMDQQIAALKAYTGIEVSEANLKLLRTYFFDLSSILIKAGDYETFD